MPWPLAQQLQSGPRKQVCLGFRPKTPTNSPEYQYFTYFEGSGRSCSNWISFRIYVRSKVEEDIGRLLY